MAIDMPMIWQSIESNRYLLSLTYLASFFLIAKLFLWVSEKIFLRLARKTKTLIDDKLIENTNRPISLLLLLVGVRLALLPLSFGVLGGYDIEKILVDIVTSLIILNITYVIIVVMDTVIDHWGHTFAEKTRSAIDDSVVSLFHKISRTLIIIFGMLFVLPVWGIQVGPLLASLGIAGIAIAFALQNSLSNIFGGITLIMDKSIKVGEVIKIDNNTFGTVIDIGIRSTKIRNWDNELIIVPNGQLANSKIQNYNQPDLSARVVIEFGVAYGSDPDKVKSVVTNVLRKVEGFKPEPEPIVRFHQMADFSLNFKAFFWVESYTQRINAKDQATGLIYNALNTAKIDIPFPTRTVYLKK